MMARSIGIVLVTMAVAGGCGTGLQPDSVTTSTSEESSSESDASQAMDVARRFLDLRASGDIDGMVGMLTSIEAYDDGADPYYYETINQVFVQQLVGLQCTEPATSPLTVECNATVTNAVQTAKGLSPCETDLFVTVEDDRVSSFTSNDNCDSFYFEQWIPFEVWIKTHYPEHRPLMYDLERTTNHSGLVTEASRSLWFDHMSEYLSEIQTEPAD